MSRRSAAHALRVASRRGSLLPTALVAAGPLGLWRMNDAASPVADYSGNGRTGAVTAATLQQQPGPDDALYPDWDAGAGTANTIQWADADAWTLTGGKTIFLLVRPSSVATAMYYVTKAAASQYEWQIDATSSGHIEIITFTSAGATVRGGFSPPGTLIANQWNALAITTVGTPASASTFKINVNGVWVSMTHTGSGSGYGNRTSPMVAGIRPDVPSTNRFDGSMAWLGVYSQLADSVVDGIMAAARSDLWVP